MGKVPSVVYAVLGDGHAAHQYICLMRGEGTHGGAPVRGPQFVLKALILGNGLQNIHGYACHLTVIALIEEGTEIPIHGDDPCIFRVVLSAAHQQETCHRRAQDKRNSLFHKTSLGSYAWIFFRFCARS